MHSFTTGPMLLRAEARQILISPPELARDPPAVVWEWFWRDRQDFPQPKQTGKKPSSIRAVRHMNAQLGGKPVRDALAVLRNLWG
jgi:hypothetical protein